MQVALKKKIDARGQHRERKKKFLVSFYSADEENFQHNFIAKVLSLMFRDR